MSWKCWVGRTFPSNQIWNFVLFKIEKQLRFVWICGACMLGHFEMIDFSTDNDSLYGVKTVLFDDE